MNLQQIRYKTAYTANAQATYKAETRRFAHNLVQQYPIALTLTLKQTVSVTNAKGSYKRAINVDDCKAVAKRFMQKLDKEVYGNAAKRYNKTLDYIAVCEGLHSDKHLHLHMRIGTLPTHVKLNQITHKIHKIKQLVKQIDTQFDVQIADNGWTEYITKEISKRNTDAIFFDLM